MGVPLTRAEAACDFGDAELAGGSMGRHVPGWYVWLLLRRQTDACERCLQPA